MPGVLYVPECCCADYTVVSIAGPGHITSGDIYSGPPGDNTVCSRVGIVTASFVILVRGYCRFQIQTIQE